MKMKALKYDLCVQFVKRINFYFEHYFTSIMQWINSKYLNLTLKKSSTKWYQNVYTYTQVSLECTFLAMYFQWGLYFFPILFTVLYMTMYKKTKKNIVGGLLLSSASKSTNRNRHGISHCNQSRNRFCEDSNHLCKFVHMCAHG